MSWQTIDHGTSVDVVPLHDDREHAYGDECWCNPVVEQTDGVPLISHNSVREQEIAAEQLWSRVPLRQALRDVIARCTTGYTYDELKRVVASGEDLLEDDEVKSVDKTVNVLMHLFKRYKGTAQSGGKEE